MRRVPDSDKLYKLVGKNIGRRRKEAKLSQTRLAARCDLTRGSVANIESGNQRPTLHTLWTIAEALRVDMRSLLPSTDEVSTSETDTGTLKITRRLKEAAGGSQDQVVSFIVRNRERGTRDANRE